jgi:pyruvate formate lyase activating enzyme
MKEEKEAMFWKREKDKIRCELCPQNCLIAEGKVGFCGVRQNKDNKLITLVYNKPCSVNLDPIEKKPLYHFLPGETALSIGTVGCNFACEFCQNWEISKAKPDISKFKIVKPEQIIEIAKQNNAKIIAYTYTEPTIFYEYMLDIAKLAKKEGIKNVIVSNGFINEKPLKKLAKYIDGANIDLKAFDKGFYKKNCSGRLEPVLKALKLLKENNIWLEITNLIIPGRNDDMKKIKEMCKWIKNELGEHVPLHFSRFFPMYKMDDIESTPTETLEKAANIAKKYLNYVYMGNVPADDDTYCPNCGKKVISRMVFSSDNNLKQGKCSCGQEIPGVF